MEFCEQQIKSKTQIKKTTDNWGNSDSWQHWFNKQRQTWKGLDRAGNPPEIPGPVVGVILSLLVLFSIACVGMFIFRNIKSRYAANENVRSNEDSIDLLPATLPNTYYTPLPTTTLLA